MFQCGGLEGTPICFHNLGYTSQESVPLYTNSTTPISRVLGINGDLYLDGLMLSIFPTGRPSAFSQNVNLEYYILNGIN